MAINYCLIIIPLFSVSLLCIWWHTNLYTKRNDAKNNAAYRAQKHTPETLIGWFAVGIEEVLNGVVQVVNDDWGWETELDKANSANHDLNEKKHN